MIRFPLLSLAGALCVLTPAGACLGSSDWGSSHWGSSQPGDGPEIVEEATPEGLAPEVVFEQVRALQSRWKRNVEGSTLQLLLNYWIGQQASLDRISEDYEDLADRVRDLVLRLDDTYGAAIDAIEAEGRTRSEQWDEIMNEARDVTRERLAESPPERAVAMLFLAEVEGRLHGRSQSPFRELSLAFNPTYSERPAEEMLDGFWAESAIRVPNSNTGVLVFKRPLSWMMQTQPGDAGRALLKTRAGLGDIVVVIGLSQLPETAPALTEEMLAYFVDPEFIDENTPGVTRLLERGRAQILGSPAVWSVHATENKSETDTLRTVTLSMHSGFDSKYLNLQFTAGVRENDEAKLPSVQALAVRLEQHQALIEMVLTSLRLDGYERRMEAPEAEPGG